MPVRQITDSEKEIVRASQASSNGTLLCFISGEVISPSDEIEYDHVYAYSYDGPSDLANVRAVLKHYNRRKKDQTLIDVRNQLLLERLYLQNNNNVKLQDILSLKNITNINVALSKNSGSLELSDSGEKRSFQLYVDPILNVEYFYGRVPIKWIQNDDQEGLQPRVIDMQRLLTLSRHLKNHPQLAPAIARLMDNKIRLFDGQHKTAAQVFNDVIEIDCKVFLSPDDVEQRRKLFDALMITNLDAHSKLKQMPFYSSTLIERFSVIYKELWEEFTDKNSSSKHSEKYFYEHLFKSEKFSKPQATEILRAAITESALNNSAISKFISEASKDQNYALSQELLKKSIFPHCLYLEPSEALFDSQYDYRNVEGSNFRKLAELFVKCGYLNDWAVKRSGSVLTTSQVRARRIWHKGSALTWGPYLQDIIINACNLQTNDEREKLLYRPLLTENELSRIETSLKRLFDHTLWLSPDPEVDKLLVSAQKQDELFRRNSLTVRYVLTGTP